MRNKYDKIFALKGWIANTEQGAKQLKKRHQSVSDKKIYRGISDRNQYFF